VSGRRTTCGPDRGLRPALVGEDGDRRRTFHRMARHRSQQVLRVAERYGKATSTTVGFPGISGWSSGKGGDHPFPFEESAGRLSAVDVHDVGRRHRGREPVECVASFGQAGCWRSGRGSRPRKARASSSRSKLTSIGTSTFLTSTSAARSTTCAACWTATAGDRPLGFA